LSLRHVRSCFEIPRMPTPSTLKSPMPTPSSLHRPSRHKSRTARRRGRANVFHTDDEIEREARSDSDTNEDDQSSSVDSDTDSETEPASEDVPQDGHATLLSPSTTPPVINGNGSKDGDDHAPLLAAPVDWSEMVADEVANGTTELPVIDFADLDENIIHAKTPCAPVQRRAPKSKRPTPRRRSSEPVPPPTLSEPSSEPPIPPASPAMSVSHPEPKTTSTPPPHRRGQTARQAYQERLESDPSYVPTVGEFWGHDDRLLDKDLRSLSGWWRGRWQGGARGRPFGPRGRGRGRDRGDTNAGNDSHSIGEAPPSPQGEVPPVDRPWTHDGYEELKRREEQRLQRQDPPPRSNNNSRGSQVGFTPRGRGFGRGRFSPRPSTTRSTQSPSPMSSRTWFLVKPERPWTKHHDLFLYSDPSQRPRPNQGPSYRVKLPGTGSEVFVQAPAQPSQPRAPTPPHDPTGEGEDTELVFTVSLPPGRRKPEAAESTPTPAAVSAFPSTPTCSPEQVTDHVSVELTPPPISPAVASSIIIPASPPVLHEVTEDQQPPATSEPSTDDPFKLREPPPPTVIPLPTSIPAQINPTTSTSSTVVSPSASAPISHSATTPEGGLLWRSPPPQLQTTFTQPVPASASSYTSTYPYPPVSAHTLPPGVALDAHGMPYELSTGRPLYLAAPPQVHTPVYMVPFPHMHSHVQHRPHASPDPSLFAPPRQGSRIEIRRPDVPSEDSHLVSTQIQAHTSRPSALRASASAPAFIPALAATPAPHEFYPSPPPEVAPAPNSAAMMGYSAYPQPPYYGYGGPEGYAYPPPQFVEYDAYNADPRVSGSAPAQAVYY
jgi:hypothetical protein